MLMALLIFGAVVGYVSLNTTPPVTELKQASLTLASTQKEIRRVKVAIASLQRQYPAPQWVPDYPEHNQALAAVHGRQTVGLPLLQKELYQLENLHKEQLTAVRRLRCQRR